MATQTTGGGSTTSFSNTPQAKDDTYTYLEDVLRADSTLYNSATNTIILDVMANDLGGNAKSLFSVDDGDGNPITADFDLLAKDIDANGVSAWEKTLNGNWVRINNGKVEFRIADGSGIVGQGASVDSLNADQPFSDQFVYAIRLGNGTLSEATVKINITGANDKATIAVDGTDDHAVSEAGVSPGNTPFAGDATAGGKLKITDADSGEAHFKPLTSAQLNGIYGTFTFDSSTGVWTYLLDNTRAATQSLSQGQAVTETLTVTSADGGTTYPITVTVTGTNDAPVAVADTASSTENQTLTVNVLANDTDVDNGHSFTLVSASAPSSQGSASVVGNQVQFNPGTDFDHLAQGATATVTISYTMKDEWGAQSSSTLTVTVTGTNDAPVAHADTAATTENQSIMVNVLANDTDVDDGSTFSLVSASTPSGQGSASIVGNQVQFDPGSDFDHLAEGETATVTVDYTMKDEFGAQSSSTVTITVTGTNDAPTLSGGGTLNGAIKEDSGTYSANGSFGFGDLDSSDHHSVSFTSGGAGYLGTFTPSVSDDSTGDGSGTVSWTFNVNNADLQFLAKDETRTQTYTVILSDGHGGTVSQLVTIVITGTNDEPVITSAAQAPSLSEDAGAPASGTITFNDVDLSDTHTASATAHVGNATSLGTFSIDPSVTEAANAANGSVGWTYTVNNAAAQYLAVGESAVEKYDVTFDDGHGGTVTEVVTVTITGSNDGVVITAGDVHGDVTEDSGTYSDSGSFGFTDVDLSDVHSVSVAPDAAGYLGTLTATKTDDSTGDGAGSVGWSFSVANADLQFLGEGETRTQTYTVTVDDGHGGSNTQTVTVVLTGDNDPVVITAGDVHGDVTEDSGTYSDSGSFGFTDVDLSDVHSVSVAPDAAGYLGTLTATKTDDSTGDGAGSVGWTFSVANADLQFLGEGEARTQTYTVTVDDGHGGNNTQTVTVVLTGDNDPVVITSGPQSQSISEDGNSVGGTITFNDVDLSDTHSASATADAGNLTSLGTFSIDPSVTEAANAANGSIGWSYTVDNAAAQYLAVGESAVEKYDVTFNDGHGSIVTEVVTVTITGQNDAPVAAAISGDANEDGPAATLTASFTDADTSDAHTFTIDTTGTVGSVVNNGDGTFSYNPNGGFEHLALGQTATDTFTYTVDDGHGGVSTETATVTIHGQNDAPSASATNDVFTDEDTASAAVSICATDVDDGAVLSYALKSGGSPTHGSVSFDQNAGTFVYTPAADYHGGDSFTIVITDNYGATTEQVVSVTVNSVNDDPVAVNDPVTTNEDNAVTFDVRTNDSDVDGDSPSVTKINGTSISVGNPVAISGGSISLGADGQLTYTPTADFNGTPSFTYTISDGHGGTADATVNLTVSAVNDAPVATITALTYSATEQTTLHLHGTGLSISDVDAGSGSMTVTLAVTEGVITIFTGSTGVGVSNSGTSSVTITGTLTQINDLLAGNGGATVNYFDGPNQFDGYDAPSASATLTMTVHDNGNTGGGDLSSSDTATINITAVNDAPVATIAHTYGVIEQQNLTLHGTGLSISDVDAANGTMTVTLSVTEGVLNVAAGTSGALVSNSGTSSVTITGSQSQIDDLLAGGHGATVVYNDNLDNPSSSVTLSLTVHDNGNTGGGDLSSTATTTITVAPVNDDPTLGAVTAGSISEVDQSSSTPSSGLAGTLSGADVDGDTLTYGIQGGSPAGGNLVSLAGSYGTLTVDTVTGAYTYTPLSSAVEGLDVGENPTDSFTVTVSDGHGGLATQVYSVNLHGADDTPTLDAVASGSVTEVVNSSSTTSSGLTGNVVGHDVDVETLSYGIQGGSAAGTNLVSLAGSYGTLTVNTVTGAYTYTQNAGAIDTLSDGQHAQDAFTVTVSDGDAPLGTQTYTVNLTGANDQPDIRIDTGDTGSVILPETNAPLSSTGKLTVTDVDANDTISVSNVYLFNVTGSQGSITDPQLLTMFNVAPTSGIAANAGDANNLTWTFNSTPQAFDYLAVGQSVILQFGVEVSDGHGGTDTEYVSVKITGSNDVPTVTGALTSSATEGDASYALNLLSGASDKDSGETATLSILNVTYTVDGGSPTGTAPGGVSLSGTTLTVDPNNAAFDPLNTGQSRTIVVNYDIKDAQGATVHQTETITINGVTDAVDTQSPTDIVFNLNPASASFSGNNGLGAGEILGSFTATDADSTAWTFALQAGQDSALFSLSSSQSVNSVNVSAGSNIPSGNYTFTVIATDPAGHSKTETFHVAVGTSGADGNVPQQFQFTVTNGTDVDFGFNGQDTITGGPGDDALVGGQNADQLTGGGGADQLIGGQGSDTFVYTGTSDSTPLSHDTIFDFEETVGGEQIDLHLIDANLNVAGDQAFAFQLAQTTAVINNTVTWYQDAAHNQTIIQADNNGDGVADLVIYLNGLHNLTGTGGGSDFIL